MIKKIFLNLIITIILSINVLALGVGPSRVSMDFVPGGEIEQEVCITGSSTPYLNLTISGNQKEGIEILKAKNILEGNILDYQLNPCFKYHFTIPDKISTPGLNRNQIEISEMPGELQNNIGIRIIIYHQIDVHVPYPGKYIQLNSFIAKNSRAKEMVPMSANFESKGYETIASARGEIKIYDKDDKLLDTIYTNTEKNIQTNEQRNLFVDWDPKDNKEGNYYAIINVKYDELNITSRSDFKLGALDVSLVSYTENLTIGGLKPFIAKVDSLWSEPIDNVRIIGTVFNETDGSTLLNFETVTRTIFPWGTTEVGSYVDTDKIGIGKHDMKLTLFFDKTEKTYNETINIMPVPVVEPVKEPSKIFTTKNILIASILILLIILIAVLSSIFFPKKKNEQKQETTTQQTMASKPEQTNSVKNTDNKPNI